jgi:hypothetical protein
MSGVLILVVHALTILVIVRILFADFECLIAFAALEGETRASIMLFVVFFAMRIIIYPSLSTSGDLARLSGVA